MPDCVTESQTLEVSDWRTQTLAHATPEYLWESRTPSCCAVLAPNISLQGEATANAGYFVHLRWPSLSYLAWWLEELEVALPSLQPLAPSLRCLAARQILSPISPIAQSRLST